MKISLALSFVIAVFSCLSLTASAQRDHPWFAAKCLERGRQCFEQTANRAGACRKLTPPYRQPYQCRRYACQFCLGGRSSRRSKGPCKVIAWTNLCRPFRRPTRTNRPRPTPTRRPPPPPPSGKCTYTADSQNRIVIGLGNVPLKPGWSRTSRRGRTGIIYERSKNHGIDSPGKGVMCFDVRARTSGNYYLSAVSWAPHHTENNDVWVKCSKKVNFWRNGRLGFSHHSWFKAYQNRGSADFSEDWHSKDHDPHKMVIPDVKSNEKFECCLSGRSYRYEMYSIVLLKCSGKACTGAHVSGISSYPRTPCN